MSTAQCNPPQVVASPNADALKKLNDLRAAMSASGLGSAADLLPAMSTAIDQLVVEHQGMAEELLCVYEQLGIVFEVTRRMAGVQDESQVIGLFLESLRRSFEDRAVLVARLELGNQESEIESQRTASPAWRVEDSAVVVNGWLTTLLDRAVERRAVVVEPAEPRQITEAVSEVMVSPVFSGEKLVCALVILRPQGVAAFKASEMMLVDSLSTFCGDLIRSHHLVRELRDMSIAMVRSLVSTVDQKDEYTCGHSLRVAHYATTLGRELGLSELDLQMLQWSALLHDVGKIGIRDEVLKKEGKLTHDEFAHIKEHPVRSHKVVQQVPQLAGALDGVLHHHERFDGSGYPSGLKGKEIPLQARIIQIADVFDALTSNRSYRKAYDWQRALAIMGEEAGKTIDPNLQRVFDRLIHDSIDGREGAWERMVARASQFDCRQ